MIRSQGSAVHDTRWTIMKTDALNGFLPALQACCSTLVRLDPKDPRADTLFVELHDVLLANFRVEDAPSDRTDVYDFVETNLDRLCAVSCCLDILLFGTSAPDERGSASIFEIVWPAFWRWSVLILTLFKDGWTPMNLGMCVGGHRNFIRSVDAICFILKGRSQTIADLRKSTPELVLPSIYAFLSLNPSSIYKLGALPEMRCLVCEYITPTYLEEATFDPVALVERAACEMAGSLLACLRWAVDNRSRIDYTLLFGHAVFLNAISESEAFVRVGRHLFALRATRCITRLLRIVGTESNQTDVYPPDMSSVCQEFLRYLNRTSFPSGVRSARCAMSAGLLDALVSLHGLARHDQTMTPEQSERLFDAMRLVMKHARHYLIFRSYIALSSRRLRSMEERRLLVNNPGAELLDSFLLFLRDRVCLKERMDQTIYVCQRPECLSRIPSAQTQPRSYRRCSGCKFAVYCSRACQRAHWKSGHKLECRMDNDKYWYSLSFQDKRFLEFLVTDTLNEQSDRLAERLSRLNGCSSGITDLNVRITFNVGVERGDISFHSANGVGPPGIFAALPPDSCWMCIVLPSYKKGVDSTQRFSILKVKTQRDSGVMTAVTVGAPEIHQGASFTVWELFLSSAV